MSKYASSTCRYFLWSAPCIIGVVTILLAVVTVGQAEAVVAHHADNEENHTRPVASDNIIDLLPVVQPLPMRVAEQQQQQQQQQQHNNCTEDDVAFLRQPPPSVVDVINAAYIALGYIDIIIIVIQYILQQHTTP
jgi:hypothetical protein